MSLQANHLGNSPAAGHRFSTDQSSSTYRCLIDHQKISHLIYPLPRLFFSFFLQPFTYILSFPLEWSPFLGPVPSQGISLSNKQTVLSEVLNSRVCGVCSLSLKGYDLEVTAPIAVRCLLPYTQGLTGRLCCKTSAAHCRDRETLTRSFFGNQLLWKPPHPG